MQRFERMGAVLALAMTWGLLAGCQGEMGPMWTAKEYDPSTAVFINELEVIPNAQLARVDTRPVSRLGRMAFTRGVDRIVVATRITSWADPVSRNWMGRSDVPESQRQLRTREIERAWIAIPYGTRNGERIQVEDLMLKFQTGYDHREQESDGFYNQPYGIEGTIAILEEKPDVVVVEMNLEIRPKNRADWRLRGVMEVPITYRGIHARLATEADQLIVNNVRQGSGRIDVPLGMKVDVDGPNVIFHGQEPTALAPASIGRPASPTQSNPVADPVDTTDDGPDVPLEAGDDARAADLSGALDAPPAISSSAGDRDPLNPSQADLIAQPDPSGLDLSTNLFPPSNDTVVPGPRTTPTVSPTIAPNRPAQDPQTPAAPAATPGSSNPEGGIGDAAVDPDAARAQEQAQADAAAAADGKVPTEIDGQSIVGKWYVNTSGHEFRFQFYDDGVFIFAVNTGPIGQLGGRAPTWTAGKFRLRSSFIIMNIHKFFEDGKDQTENLSARFSLAKLTWETQGDKRFLVMEGDLKGKLGRVKLRLYPKEFVDLDAFELLPGRAQPDRVDDQSRVSGPDR